MRRTTANILLVLLLAASLGAKLAALDSQSAADAAETGDISTFLATRGFALSHAPPKSAPAWIIGTRGGCRVRIADVAAEGWTSAIAARQAAGERLLYAFDGRFHSEQPVWRTRLEKYRRRLLRYFGLREPPLAVRVLTVSDGCPPGTLRPTDAELLSR